MAVPIYIPINNVGGLFFLTPSPAVIVCRLFDDGFSEQGGFPGGLVVNNLPANAGDVRDAGSIPGSVKSSAVGNSNQLQYSCLENSM